MCGIIGIMGFTDVASEIAFGLNSLQHRGQDAAGILTFDRRFRIKKKNGLVNNIFDDAVLRKLQAPVGLGHVRYATQGTIDSHEAQPIYMNYPYGLAMVHNGNVTNSTALTARLRAEQNRIIETSNDLELILYTLASHLEKRVSGEAFSDGVFRAVEETQKSVEGAYSTLTILANEGLLAFNDPCGIRPLFLGKRITGRGSAFAFASETSALEFLGYGAIRQLEAGEAVFIDSQRQVHSRILHRRNSSFCVFEYIYFSREDSKINGRLVATERVNMGKMLARNFQTSGVKPDVVIDVPSSAYFFASGLAEELGIPYRRGLSKNKYVGRSFLLPSQDQRDRAVRLKLSPIRPVIEGRKVAVLDDSIVRGTTSKHLVELLRDAGAAAVYFVSAAPPIRFPCVYGIDMSIKTELIAANNDVRDIAAFLKADAVVYQSLSDLQSMYKDCGFCYACFSGEYPTGISPALLEEIESQRIQAKKSRVEG